FEESVISFTDATNKAHYLSPSPEKVAVLFSSFADIWVSAGGKVDITVYESVERGFADNNAILVDNGAGKSIDNEALIAASPSLVICSADIAAQLDTAKLCNNAGIPAIALRVEDFEDYLEVLKLFTLLTGNDENYKTYGKALCDEVKKLTEFKCDDSILFIRAGSAARFTKAKNASDHFAAAMLKELGTRNIAEAAPILLDGLSFEEILLQNPKHIFISTMGDEQSAVEYINSLFAKEEWAVLDAVKNGNVHFLPKELFQYKPNSRFAEAYRYLINILKGN
ncbi:MAG: ABC transporter substrate-binding protein, partial [Ruminococcaceae bacterium]|nr:ABC transporter substrate-binding protein [Oscillospiraceae bacterium]